MAIVNRDLDSSEKNRTVDSSVVLAVAASAGVDYPFAVVPYPATLKAVTVAALGVSGSPFAQLAIVRNTAGGATTIVTGVASSLAIQAAGTSGAQAMSLAAPGSTLLALQSGDVLVMRQLFSGGNVASIAAITAVLQATQDIRQTLGQS